MSHSRKAVVSLAALRLGRRTIYVVPVRGVAYFIASLAIVFAIALVVDRVVLGALETAGWTSGELWARHNKLIEENHRRKTTTNECELRHWDGQPLMLARRKILVMGDSFVWGPPYITLNHLWWRQLEIELERRGYYDVAVVAAGHPGWSTRRQLECAKQLVAEIKPDLIIWGYVTNDPDEKIVPQIFDSQDQPPYGQRIRRQLKRLLPNLSFKFESLRANKLAVQYTGPDYGYAYPDWELKLVEGENFEQYRNTVQEVAAFIRQTQIPAFLHTLPHFPSREYFEPRYAPVLKEWQASGVTVNNTLDEFVRRYGNVAPTGPAALRWGINPSDSHPGPRATHFHAVMAADFLEQMWPVVLGPKDESRPHELAINDWLPFDMNVRKVSANTFDVDYPPTTGFLPQRPGEEPAAIVALRNPLPVDEIRLEGPGLVGGKVWASLTDPREHCDEDRWQELGEFTGDSFAYKVPRDSVGRELAQIRFRAAIKGSDRRLRLTLIQHSAEEERP